MSKSKPKISVGKQSIKDPELIDMFNRMLGNGDPDPNIVVPKYEKILSNSKGIIQILETFVQSPFAKVFSYDFKKSFNEIVHFVNDSKKQLDELKLENNDKILSGDDLNKINANPEKIHEYLSNIDFKYKIIHLGESYNKLKDCNMIKDIIMTARNFKNSLMLEKERSGSQKHDLEDKDKLSANFITNADGDFLTLFSFSSLDFKQIYYHDNMDPNFSKYILMVLHLVYKKIMFVIKEITSPDIDVDKFASLLVNNIDDIKKHIPRCEKAFEKIKQSVDLLKSNFGEYYKDFISSQNPGIIVEHFVIDVAKSSKADPAVTRQFREIVKFYRTHMQSKIKDPKVKKIFSMVGANLDILEEKTRKETKKDRAKEAEELFGKDDQDEFEDKKKGKDKEEKFEVNDGPLEPYIEEMEAFRQKFKEEKEEKK